MANIKISKMKSVITIVLTLGFIFTSCKTSQNTKTKTSSPAEFLTKNTWKTYEIRQQLSNNTAYYYKRGKRNNNVNYDSDSLKFNPDNTGIYYYEGEEYTTKWNFLNPEKTEMTIIINYSRPLRINWEYIKISETLLTYTQFSSANGVSYLASGTRVPN